MASNVVEFISALESGISAMPIWEYRLDEATQHNLWHFGEAGWEAVGIASEYGGAISGSKTLVLFKRPVPRPPPKPRT